MILQLFAGKYTHMHLISIISAYNPITHTGKNGSKEASPLLSSLLALLLKINKQTAWVFEHDHFLYSLSHP